MRYGNRYSIKINKKAEEREGMLHSVLAAAPGRTKFSTMYLVYIVTPMYIMPKSPMLALHTYLNYGC